MQMRDRFAHRKCLLVQVQRTPEHDGQDIGGAMRPLGACLHDLRQPVAMMVAQLADALATAHLLQRIMAALPAAERGFDALKAREADRRWL